MIITKIYEDENKELAAVILEDGQYSNYVPCPEMVALEGEGLFEEAQRGFPDAWMYEYDALVGLSMEEAAAQAERNYTLIAQVAEKILLYPRRMSPDHQELFQIYTGEELWQALLERDNGNGAEFEL